LNNLFHFLNSESFTDNFTPTSRHSASGDRGVLLTLPITASLENHSEILRLITKFFRGAGDVESASVAVSCSKDYDVALVRVDRETHVAEKGTCFID
jgi:hypothetical protein